MATTTMALTDSAIVGTIRATAVSASSSAQAKSTMKAIRFHGQRDIRLDTIEAPRVGAGKVKIAPKFCGICGSDLHEYLGGANLIPKPENPHPITKETLPLTLGHEFSGIVEEVGDGVESVKPGDRVCVQPIIYDGDCRSCVRGLVNCCDRNGFVGLSGWGGGLCEAMVVPESCVKQLPDNVTLEEGALVEPLAVGWHAVDISPFKETDSVLILGAGPIGLAVVQVLAGRGCKNIIISEVSTKRREFAAQFGAHYTIDPVNEDMVARVTELTGGLGADVAFDAAGVQAALDPAFAALKARGTLVNIAVWEKRAGIAMNGLVFRERGYMGVATYSLGDFEAVLDAISTGKIKPAGMITKKIRLDKVVDEGFHALINDKENQVKILVDVGAGLS
ncbi:sorbitol dehydrogenase [Moelleriella libera RCEF 2490]|uniref:Sorbitol dehydrogenase n=1 Tax=Moelleriella libera RCEF 2490 TaxID=1081109 RepID=A0A168CED5_9HYPO|nr:sorbitol dehydrogenase [Moelleriella libera RCEF 2490]